MALFKVVRRSKDLEITVLGGRTRSSLAHRRHPVYVEKLLTEEERAQRRALTPTAKRLKAKGKRVRWVGAVLEVQVPSPGGGKGRWEKVQPAQEPRQPSEAGGAAGGGEDIIDIPWAGAGAGAGAGDADAF
jgi:hypothetical protein